MSEKLSERFAATLENEQSNAQGLDEGPSAILMGLSRADRQAILSALHVAESPAPTDATAQKESFVRGEMGMAAADRVQTALKRPLDTRDGEIAELAAYRAAFGGGEFNGEPIILDAETIRQRGKQYDELMGFFNQVVAAINPPDNLTPDQLTPWICATISALRSAVATAREALVKIRPKC